MIRHIVFFTVKRKEDLNEVRARLNDLGAIPHSLRFEVSLNRRIDPLSKEVDLVVYAEFADEAALEAYRSHPLYAEATRRVQPLRELRFAVDIAARSE